MNKKSVISTLFFHMMSSLISVFPPCTLDVAGIKTADTETAAGLPILGCDGEVPEPPGATPKTLPGAVFLYIYIYMYTNSRSSASAALAGIE